MTQELSADEKATVARIGIHDPEVAPEWRDTTAEEVNA
jgi:hypothetical protein